MSYSADTVRKRIARIDALAKELQAEANRIILAEEIVGLSIGTMARVREIGATVFGPEWELSIRGGMTCPPEIVAKRFLGRVAAIPGEGDPRFPGQAGAAMRERMMEAGMDLPLCGQ